MKIQTLSAVIGSKACDGGCPFCISSMTGFEQLPAVCPINKMAFEKAMRWAEIGECTTCLLTGKGEPTLFPIDITNYLIMLRDRFDQGRGFPSIELQTNGLRIGEIAQIWNSGNEIPARLSVLYKQIDKWKDLGLDYVALSLVDVDSENNKKIYLPHKQYSYPRLDTTVEFLHARGFKIRFCVMMHKDIVDDPEDLLRVISWCKEHNVEQLTVRPIRASAILNEKNKSIVEYTKKNTLTVEQRNAIKDWIDVLVLDRKAKKLLTLMHGKHAANVYDVEGQNFCLSDCLTVEENGEDIRTLIFYGNGDIFYDWQYNGARLR